MKQEDKDLLLKDLCARLPYGIICEDGYGNVLELNGIDKPNTITFKCSDKTFWTTDLDKCKPYLFPLSSMTEEQKTSHNFLKHSAYASPTKLIDFYNKNHIDYRGLIPMGLAIDCTNLNIY